MTYNARISEDGKLSLPADVAVKFGWQPGDTVVLKQQGGTLVIRSYQDIVREGQAKFRSLLPTGYNGSMVDELIAEREAEAAAE